MQGVPSLVHQARGRLRSCFTGVTVSSGERTRTGTELRNCHSTSKPGQCLAQHAEQLLAQQPNGSPSHNQPWKTPWNSPNRPSSDAQCSL